jgi:hypothetical protein
VAEQLKALLASRRQPGQPKQGNDVIWILVARSAKPAERLRVTIVTRREQALP